MGKSRDEQGKGAGEHAPQLDEIAPELMGAIRDAEAAAYAEAWRLPDKRDPEPFLHMARDDLATAEEHAARLADQRDRQHIRYAILQARMTITILMMGDVHPADAERTRCAAREIRWACRISEAGGDPFELLITAAEDLMCARTRAAMDESRRDRAGHERSASRILQALAVEHPEISSAAELRRLAEKRVGHKIDPSAARTVVREVRAKRAKIAELEEELANLHIQFYREWGEK